MNMWSAHNSDCHINLPKRLVIDDDGHGGEDSFVTEKTEIGFCPVGDTDVNRNGTHTHVNSGKLHIYF